MQCPEDSLQQVRTTRDVLDCFETDFVLSHLGSKIWRFLWPGPREERTKRPCLTSNRTDDTKISRKTGKRGKRRKEIMLLSPPLHSPLTQLVQDKEDEEVWYAAIELLIIFGCQPPTHQIRHPYSTYAVFLPHLQPRNVCLAYQH